MLRRRRPTLARRPAVSILPARMVLLLLASPALSEGCRFDFPFPQAVSTEDAAPGLDALAEDAGAAFDGIGEDALAAPEAGADGGGTTEDALVAMDGTLPIDPPVSLEITSPAQRIHAGDCSSMVVIEAWDGAGRPSGVTTATVIDLTAQSDPRFTFYSDSGCRSQIARVEIPAGGTTASFRFRATLSGAANLVVSANGLSPDIQTQIIEGGSAFALAFSTPPQIAALGDCSEAVTLQAIDEFGNATTVSSTTTIFLSANPASNFSFFSDRACSTLASSVQIRRQRGSVSFYFVGSRVWGVTTTASGLGAPVAQRQSICEANCSACGGSCCLEHCGNSNCMLSCSQASCPCTFDCDEGSDNCRSSCTNGSSCEIDCAGSNDCIVTCDQGSSCVIACEGSSDCRSITCDGGADCLLRCGANPQCGFSSCNNGTATATCAGGVVACNRPCP